MARLLYWGQQGLQRDLGAAFKLYEEAAQGGDATALYDYGIVLIKVSASNGSSGSCYVSDIRVETSTS